MSTAVTQKDKPKAIEPVQKPTPLARGRDFPFILSRFRDEFDRMFERFFSGWPVRWSEREDGWRWGMEVQEQENAVVVRAEAPGFEAGDFDVQVQDGQLTLRASRKTETKKDGEEEWSQRECFESVTLPASIDKDKVEAKYHNGILTITMVKTPEGKGRRVPVKAS
jgi:HSP20 family protein